MRNKEEIDQHIEESPDEQSRDDQSRDDQSRHDQSRHDQSRHEHNPSPDIEKSENDFDADNFDYDPEEYTYKQTSRVITGSEKAKREQPYYLPFTDVPYVGEVDSDFNLRRFVPFVRILQRSGDLIIRQ